MLLGGGCFNLHFGLLLNFRLLLLHHRNLRLRLHSLNLGLHFRHFLGLDFRDLGRLLLLLRGDLLLLRLLRNGLQLLSGLLLLVLVFLGLWLAD